MQKVKKRDGKIVEYDAHKNFNAVRSANVDSKDKKMSIKEISEIVYKIEDRLKDITTPSVERIQDVTEDVLMKCGRGLTAKSYILYRSEHAKIRESQKDLMDKFYDLTFKSSEELESKRDNANINTDSPMGTMLKYGTESSNYFSDNYMLPKEFSAAHKEAFIHIHDKDFEFLTFNCLQMDIIKLLAGGFNTGHGYIREPQTIRSYASLACIALQSSQNDMFGGQSIFNWEYGMAIGVRKTFKKIFCKRASFAVKLMKSRKESATFVKYLRKLMANDEFTPSFENVNGLIQLKQRVAVDFESEEYSKILDVVFEETSADTENETHQAMESVIHNLNSMHSRAGSQVPFTSLNFGTDTSPEGRLVVKHTLLAEDEGLGNGETPIFPITVFKLKSGINYNHEDKNYDLFKLAMKVSAKRLFPNFCSIDATYNLQYYKPGNVSSEIATMGCRTRTIANNYDPAHEEVGGRGNFSFTTLNLPKMAIEANKDINKFFEIFDKYIDMAKRQLIWRFDIIAKKHVYNFPFLMGQGIWLGSDKLGKNDEIGEILKQASLSIGFCGLAECLVSLTGKHHGESQESQELGLKIIKHLRDMTDKYCIETGLNFSTFATPAESTAGTFAKSNRKHYGLIEGVTDRDYITNSSHVPVYYPIKSFKKIDIEAPYHELENAGHIAYVEMDGDPTKNLKAFESTIRYMHDKNMGYFSINHPVDRDPVCGYTGIIANECPHCHRRESIPNTLITIKKIKAEWIWKNLI